METGQVVGTVTDPTGAVIPGAKVTVKSVTTQVARAATTSAAGLYGVTSLMPGQYDVTVEASGFARAQRRVEVTVGGRTAADFRLEVGTAETIVQVEEAAEAINTTTQTVGTTVSTRQILELPTLTRDPYDLVLIGGSIGEDDPSARGVGVAINGQRAASTNILLDGATNIDEFTSSVGQTVPLDSVQEFSVLTSNFTAEYGRAGGGVVNVATKSGTNEFHGTVYEFNRVSKLASNSFDNNANEVPKPTFTRNQFGYSVGGPIKKEKVFFFNSTEWLRVRSGSFRTTYIPTSELLGVSHQRTRDFFSALGQRKSDLVLLGRASRNDLRALGTDPCTGSAANGPCQMLNPNMPLFDRVTYSRPSDGGAGDPTNTLYLVGRVDANISDKTQMYVRYAIEDGSDLAGSVADSPYQGCDTGEKNRNQNILLLMIRTFSPSAVLQSKLVFNRLNNVQPFGDRPAGPTLFFTGTRSSLAGTLTALPGYLPFNPGTGIPFGGPQNFIQWYEDMNVTRGSHQFRFGGSLVHLRDNRTFGAYQNPANHFSTRSFGNGMDNFLVGLLSRFQSAVDPQGKYPCVNPAQPTPDCTVNLPFGQPSFSRSNRFNEFALYMQDSWRIARNFTLNLGVRWEYFGVQHNKDPKLDSNYYDGQGRNVYEQIRNGKVYLAPDSPVGGLWAKDFNNFAPRVGFAWDVTGNGTTSVRGGYGIGYERNFGNVTFNVIQNPPNYAVIALDAGADVPIIPVSTDIAGPLAGSSGSKALPAVSLRNVDANIRTAYAHFWSASFERTFGRSVILGVDYTGSKGEKLYSLEDPNRLGAGNVYLGDPCRQKPCTDRLRTSQYTFLNRRGGKGLSNYHGVNVRFELRNLASAGLDLLSNYTVGRAIDNLSSTFSESYNNWNLGLLDPFNPELDRGYADFDNRQRWALSARWELPIAQGATGAKRQLLGGWIFTPIFTARTGHPFTLFDSTNSFVIAPRAMFKGAPPSYNGTATPAGTPNTFKLFDINPTNVDSSYEHPITGTADFGPYPSNMTKRNSFRAPGRYNLDLALLKNFYIGEKRTLQFRFETYNSFNHSNLLLVGSENDIGSGISYASARRGLPESNIPEVRNVQLALKFIF